MSKVNMISEKNESHLPLPHTLVLHVLNPMCQCTINDKEAKKWSTTREATVRFQSH